MINAADATPTLEGALRSLYGDYERAFADAQEAGGVPPVFVVVCDDTQTSKIISDWIAGYDGFDGARQPGICRSSLTWNEATGLNVRARS